MQEIDPSTRPEALYVIALAALHADDEARPAERRVLEEALSHVQPVTALSEDRAQALREAVGASQAEPGALVDTCQDLLSDEDAAQAFSLAADVVLADRKVHAAERTLLERLKAKLAVPDDEAEAIVDLLETKHGTPLGEIDLPEPEDALVTLDVSPAEALLAFPIATAHVDQGPGPTALPPIRELTELPGQERDALLDAVTRGLDRFGREDFLAGCAEVLDDDQRQQAFVVAVQAAFIDQRMSDREATFLEEIREMLDVPASLAENVVDAVREMHRP